MALLFEDKTRWQHFLYAIPIAVAFTLLCVLGGAVGQLIQVAIVLLII